MKKLLFTLIMLFAVTTNAQTEDELKALQAPKKDSIAVLQAEVAALQGQIDALPGWKKGVFGTIGGNLAGFNNWYYNKRLCKFITRKVFLEKFC
jgi:hypothetical protein